MQMRYRGPHGGAKANLVFADLNDTACLDDLMDQFKLPLRR